MTHRVADSAHRGVVSQDKPQPTRIAPRLWTACSVGMVLSSFGPLGCTSDEGVSESDAPPRTAGDAAIVGEDWPHANHDYEGTRATKMSAIDSSTVSDPTVAWQVEMPGLAAYGSAATNPLIIGDTVFIEDLGSSVRAIDVHSGDLLWDDIHEELNIGPNGVAVGDGRVFALRGSFSVVAYDAESGAELWVRKVTDTETDGIDIQPLFYDGKVLVSTVPVSLTGIYTGGDAGILKALDPTDGSEIWTFRTVDSDDVWGNPDVNSGGGSWYPPTVDVERGRVYWAVANPAPFPGVADAPNGTSRPGANLYTNSVVVLDVANGVLDWYHQTIEHDLFDRDLIHTVLAEVGPGGRPVVLSVGKAGVVHSNDRVTGELLWKTPVGRHENDDLLELTGPVTVYPGSFGGVLTPPAYADGVIYVATLNAPTDYVPDETAYFPSNTGTSPGQVVAVDAATGDIVWDVEVDGDPTGGATVVNDLVLTATFQGTIFALSREDGRLVWSWEAPGGINGWPAISGNTLVWPVGIVSPALLVALRLE